MGRRGLNTVSSFVALFVALVATGGPAAAEPMSFRSLSGAPEVEAAPVETFTAADGVPIAWRSYVPPSPAAALVFYHGGGAHSAAGYEHLGAALRDDFDVAVYAPDLRGHGASGGPRGDARSVKAVYEDVSAMLQHVRAAHPEVPLFVGGHSSGAGLLLNAAASESVPDVAGYVFLAPYFGYRAGTHRETPEGERFADVSVFPFVVHSLSGGLLMAHAHAVRFRYPEDVLASDPKLVSSNTVTMASALTPTHPGAQLEALEAPTATWIGAGDELLDPDEVRAFVSRHRPGGVVELLPGENHLSILLRASAVVGPWVRRAGSPFEESP